MSTKKVKNATKTGTTTKLGSSRQTTERKSTKKEEKTVTKPRIKMKTDEEDEKKLKNGMIVKKKTKTSERAVTPPSSRVTKTQFFPSKKMYSNALNEKKNTNYNSPRANLKIQRVKDEVTSGTSSMVERPKTATLRKDSTVNGNIVQSETPQIVKSDPPVEYEDDFDSYESDFEQCSSSTSTLNSSIRSSDSESLEAHSAPRRVNSASTDDEKKLDSGNYELPESRHKQILDNIKESIEKENSNLYRDQNRSNLGSLSDEGFEDGKSLQFINFLVAQKNYHRRKSMEKKRKRGEEILSMIRLDTYSFTLFDLPAVPYDIFIKNFGKSNTIQVATQNGEDDIDEETQTDDVNFTNKWTQYPPVLPKILTTTHKQFWEEYKSNYLGVGGDSYHPLHTSNSHNSNLDKFLVSAGNLIVNIQTEKNLQLCSKSQSNNSNIPFSKGYIFFDIHQQGPIQDVTFSTKNLNRILTAHVTIENGQSILYLWNLSNVIEPEMTLTCFGQVTCAIFHNECQTLIFAGLSNGTLVLWDLTNAVLTPTYTTEINYGHCAGVVSVQSLTQPSPEVNIFNTQPPMEICSLDEDGLIIVWSVIFKGTNRGQVSENQGLAHWGSVIITINTRIPLGDYHPELADVKCNTLASDSNHLYISTNYGVIIHCLTNGGKTSVKKFLPDTPSQANCLQICPFSSDFILAGFDNGDVSFYSRFLSKPLVVLSNKDCSEDKSRIEQILWSYNRPLIFYTKDVNNTVHVWNLKASDLVPIYSIPFKDRIITMQLSPVIKTNDQNQDKTYLLLAFENGTIQVHLLGEEHDQQSLQEFDVDKRRFFNYINRYI